MNLEKISLLSNLKFSSVEKVNENFLKGKAYVLALGKNRNKSHFTKENVDRAYPSLAFAPVIGHLMFDDNGVCHLGGHDVKLDLKDFKLKSQCIPFGVVLPSESPSYEDVTESDGTVSTYLTCEVAIWINRYPELANAFYSEEVFTNQSMEIYYSKYQPLATDPTYTDIVDFTFDALCMLQKSDDDKFNVEPCFPSASIVPITYSIDKDEFSQLLNDMKEELINCFSLNNSEGKGGNALDEKLVILEKYGKTIEDLDFSIDDMSTEDFEAKMKELFGENTGTPVEPVQPVVSEPVAFSATYKQKRQALCNALDPIIVKDENGNYVEETYYYVEDFSDEWVYVEKSHWTVDNYEYKFGRFSYEFDETAMTVTLTSDFEEMVKVWLTLEEKENLDKERAGYELMKTEFEQYKSEYTVTNAEFEELKSYKETKIAEERANAETELFAKYEGKIGETNEFKTLKEKASEYTLDALTKECLCIVGMYSMTSEPTETPKDNKDPLKFSVEQPVQEDEPYGGLMKKYLGR